MTDHTNWQSKDSLGNQGVAGDEHKHKDTDHLDSVKLSGEIEKEVELLDVELLEEELEILELELFCKESPGRKPPRAKRYRIRVDKVKIEIAIPEPTGRQILEAAQKIPPDRFLLNQKICGQMKPVGLDEKVDLRTPGIERFVTLPKDQTEGRSANRRMFALPEEDTELLVANLNVWETVESNGRWLLIHNFVLPPGFTQVNTSAAIQIPSGYPSAALDMVYFYPAIVRSNGQPIPATEARVAIDGNQWQRWSRHYTAANPWLSGEYNVVTHLNLARNWVEAAALK